MKKAGRLAALLCAALILTGCQAFPSIPSSNEPSATDPSDHSTVPVTDGAKTTAPETEPDLYWEEEAVLVENGVLTVTVDAEAAPEALSILSASLPKGVAWSEAGDGAQTVAGPRLLVTVTEDGRADAYSVQVDDKGLVLSGNTVQAAEYAMRAFCTTLEENYIEGSCRVPLSRLEVQDRSLLPVPQGTELPEPATLSFSNLVYFFSVENDSDYARFESAILSAGYEKTEENSIGDNRFGTFRCDSHSIALAYSAADGSLTAVLDPTSPAPDAGSEEWDKVADTTLTQLGCNFETGNFGMGYLITLEDGSYIVIDGGTDEPDASGKTAHEVLYDLMVKNNRRADKTVLIRAWLFTNGKYDHATLAKRFFMEYGDQITVELLVLNFHPQFETTSVKEMQTAARLCGDGTEIRIFHPGQRLTVCGVTAEALYTADLAARDTATEADTDMILRITAKGQTVLFCSDMGEGTAQALTRWYGEGLKCDLLQIPSHGEIEGMSESVLTEFYRLADPEAVLWPHANANIEQLKALPANAYLLNQLHVKSVIAGSETATALKLPYAAS